MTYEQATGVSIVNAFNLFDEKNPIVYVKFEAQALKAIEKGRKKLSAKLIVNWIRWNIYMETEDENSTFRINDAYHAHFARKFVLNHPEHKSKFNFRKLRS